MILAHQIRLVPTKAQEAYFRRACGTARFTFNWALEHWQKAYKAGEKPNGMALKVEFNAIRREKFPWTYEVHRDCTSRPFENVQKAYQAFFRRAKEGKKPGFPKFKRKHASTDSFYIANDKLTLVGNRVRIPVLGWVKLREELRFQGKVQAASVKRIADKWFLSVQVDVGDYKRPRVSNGVVGVDLGLNHLATLSTGERVENLRPLKTALKRLQRLSRQHSRKVKGSSNRRKASLKLARLHYRVRSIRNDVLNKLTTRLCQENQAVGIEELAVGNMVRNHKLARSLMDAGFGEFHRQLTYKSVIYGAKITVADRFFPSSKTCSACGLVRDSLSLSERVFRCACGFSLDRDWNAALNLVPAASRDLKPVDRLALAEPPSGSVKPAWMKQELAGGHFCPLGR